MEGKLILMTGANSFLGYPILLEALTKGYDVKVVVRSEAKFNTLKEAPPSQPYLKQLSHVVIPDFDKDGVFDEVIKGVDYIIHTASPVPIPTDDHEEAIIKPSIRIVLGILRSALQEPTIKKVIITSSAGAVMADQPIETFTSNTIPSEPTGPYPNPFVAYLASKKLSYLRTRDFVHEHKPHFSIINIMPSFVIGPKALATTPEDVASGSNRHIFMPLFSQTSPFPMPTVYTHPSDVAKIHIAALSLPHPKTPQLLNFGVSNPLPATHTWNDVLTLARTHYPKAVESGILPLGGSVPGVAVPFDASQTEEVFGLTFKGFEEMVLEAVGQYVELAEKAKK